MELTPSTFPLPLLSWLLQPGQKLQRYLMIYKGFHCLREIMVWLMIWFRSLTLLQQGNRSSSSACGSADVLEALGVCIDLGPEVLTRTIALARFFSCICRNILFLPYLNLNAHIMIFCYSRLIFALGRIVQIYIFIGIQWNCTMTVRNNIVGL